MTMDQEQAAEALTRATQDFLPQGHWRSDARADGEILFRLVDSNDIALAVPFASYLVLNTAFAKAGFGATRKAGFSSFLIPNADRLPEGDCGFFHFWNIIGDEDNVNVVFALEQDRLDYVAEREGLLEAMVAVNACSLDSFELDSFERKIQEEKQKNAITTALNQATTKAFPDWFWVAHAKEWGIETLFVPCNKTSWRPVEVSDEDYRKLHLAFVSIGVSSDLISVRYSDRQFRCSDKGVEIVDRLYFDGYASYLHEHVGHRCGTLSHLSVVGEVCKRTPALKLWDWERPFFLESLALLPAKMEQFFAPHRSANDESPQGAASAKKGPSHGD